MMVENGNNFRKKMHNIMRRSLYPKLTIPVLLAVAVTFLLLLAGCFAYYQNSYIAREISNQRNQMDKVAYSINTIQEAVENVSKQVAISEVVQKSLPYPVKPSADFFVARDSIQNALGSYVFIMDYIQEVMIYTKNKETYSSLQIRDRFYPKKESWYQEFKESGEQKGYTKVHSTTISQNGTRSNILSYVLTCYSISNHTEELGDIIINLDYDSIEKVAALDTSLLEGYAIYNKNGEAVIEKGKVELPFTDISKTNGGQLKDKEGNIYLISTELGYDWIFVSEISGQTLQGQIENVQIMIILVFLLLTALISFVLFHNVRKVVEPINRLSLAAEQIGEGKFEVSVDVNTGDEVEILASAFNKMVLDVQHYTEMSVEHEKIMRRSQVDQLLLQINPHFIYNTLNSIVYMARLEGNQDIVKFVNAFISLLQNTLHVENKVFISLEEELKNAENYIVLQKYRYMDKFDEEIRCPEELKIYQVPKVILQPIVENAIFHGIAPMEGRGKLTVRIEKKQDVLEIVVEDNGIGMTEDMKNRVLGDGYVNKSGMRKIGMANVKRRIKEICGEEYEFRIKSEQGIGTKVIMELPLKEELEN